MRKIELPAAASSQRTTWWHWLVIIVLACGLVAVLTPVVIQPALVAWFSSEGEATPEAWPTVPAAYVPPVVEQAPPVIVTPTPLPTPNWRELNHLTTVQYIASSVVEAQRKTNVIWLGEMVTDRILLEAVGQVRIGIDLGQVRDVRIEGRHIEFVAPRPEVAGVELLPQRSQIYDREQSLFLSQYEGLETEALEQARQKLYEEAVANTGMMQLAEEVARLKLTEFLRKVGFTSVEIKFATKWADED